VQKSHEDGIAVGVLKDGGAGVAPVEDMGAVAANGGTLLPEISREFLTRMAEGQHVEKVHVGGRWGGEVCVSDGVSDPRMVAGTLRVSATILEPGLALFAEKILRICLTFNSFGFTLSSKGILTVCGSVRLHATLDIFSRPPTSWGWLLAVAGLFRKPFL
jgi:hypothetical protein